MERTSSQGSWPGILAPCFWGSGDSSSLRGKDTGQDHLRLLVAFLGTYEYRISLMETKAMKVGLKKRHQTSLGTEVSACSYCMQWQAALMCACKCIMCFGHNHPHTFFFPLDSPSLLSDNLPSIILLYKSMSIERCVHRWMTHTQEKT